MIKKKEIPFIMLLIFMMLYTFFGNPDNKNWSSLYFLVTHLSLILLFRDYKDANIRKIGISLNISIIIYLLLRHIMNFDINRVYNAVPFTICLIGIIYYENKKNKPK